MNTRMIWNWYQKFRVKQHFKLTYPHSTHNLPLAKNKDICLSLQQHGWQHLHILSMELMCKHFHDVIMPKMVQEVLGVVRSGDETGQYETELWKIFSTYGLTCICPSIIYQWMKIARILDWHEKPENSGLQTYICGVQSYLCMLNV